MLAQDIMTRSVKTVGPKAEVEVVARVLMEYNVSAVPVVDDDGQILGIVSEGDLIHRLRDDGGRSRSWWLTFMADRATDAAEFVKTHGRLAEHVMTKKVIWIAEDTPIADIARLLEKNHIKRVPVVHDGKLVGIVSRANLLHALATQSHSETPTVSDRIIRKNLVKMFYDAGWVTHGPSVIVKDGVVDLWGWIESEAERDAMLVAARNAEGVRKVEDHLGYIRPYARGA